MILDPVKEQHTRDIQLIKDLNLTLLFVAETHVHADHITGASLLSDATGAKTVGSHLGAPCAHQKVQHGDILHLGTLALEVIATPGHTDDSLCFYTPGHVFTGDTLFIRGCGRTDFQNGDAASLYQSVTQRLFTLPEDTVVWPGHDYKGLTCSTIAEEKRLNPRLANTTQEKFVALMAGLNLPAPKKLQESVPANRRCGRDA